MQRGNGAGILVDYDEYGYEVMDSQGGAFSGSQQMPHTATFYPEQRSQQHQSRMKPPKKPYKSKASQKQRGQGPNHGRRKNPRRKYSSEDGTPEYDMQGYYNRQGLAYQNESEGDEYNTQIRMTAGGPNMIAPSYGLEEDSSEEMSGKSDFFNDSSQSSASSDYSSSSEGSSTSKRIRKLLQYKQIQPKDMEAVRKLAKQRAGRQSRKKSKKDKKERKKKKRGSKPPRATKGGSDGLNPYR
jgi:hypothetical protein